MENYSLKKFSISDFNKMETKDENNYELIDGIVYMSPRPSAKHQNIMSNLHYELRSLLKSKPCKVFTEIELEYKDNVQIFQLFAGWKIQIFKDIKKLLKL